MNFLDADYSAIEARIVNWLAGQEDALQEYRQGIDRYKKMASVIYGIPSEQVDEHPQRFVGKQATLGCGFGMGAPKFRTTCKKMGNYDLPPGLEDRAIKAFRATHRKVVQYWYAVEGATKAAIARKGDRFRVRNVDFLVKDLEGMPFLLIRLPSGRKLAYPKPRISNRSIVFFGQQIGTNWGDVSTYGGKLVENITQAVAADVMANGAHQAEKHGYKISTLIHDEAIGFYESGQTVEEFVKHLTTLPEWAKNLPVEAKGKLIPFYKK